MLKSSVKMIVQMGSRPQPTRSWKDKWWMEEVWVIGVVPATEPPIIKSEWLEEKKKIQYLECERVWARISVPFLGLGVLVYICACLFLLAVGGALMVVLIWYLLCPYGVLMIRCLSNDMEVHYCHVTLRHWLWVNGLLFVWRLPRRTKIDVTLVHCLLYGQRYNRDYH